MKLVRKEALHTRILIHVITYFLVKQVGWNDGT